MGGAVRIGVLGLRRGAALARLARDAGMRLVAVCERDDRRRDASAAALGVAAYRDLEPFLDHSMDAVILSTTSTSTPRCALRLRRRGPPAGPPDQDVYFGVELSITGIQAMRFSLAASLLVEVPGLRDSDARRVHVGDDWFPDLLEL